MFLHKGYTPKNGIHEAILFTEENGSNTSNSITSVAPVNHLGAERQNLQSEQVMNSDSVWRPDSRINGVAEGMHVLGKSLAQPTSSTTSFPLKFQGLLDIGEKSQEKEAVLATPSSRNLQNGSSLANSVMSSTSSVKEENMDIDSSVSMPPVVVVNRSVYKGVNSLMGEENSETGCVTAKSIMNEDSPATVRIDLNAHEMEPPSSLSDTSSNVVVNLDDSLFSVSLQGERHTDVADCQVNSSEDVDIYPSRNQGKLSLNICDNACTNSSGNDSRDDSRGHVATQGFSETSQHLDTADMVDSSQAVVSACDEVKNLDPISSGSIIEDSSCGGAVASPGPASLQSHEPSDGISSSGQAFMPPVDRVVVELSPVCDSVNNSSEDHSCWSQDRALSRRAHVDEAHHNQCLIREEGIRTDDNEDSKCDSVESGPKYALDAQMRTDTHENDGDVVLETADSNVAESSSIIEPQPSLPISFNQMENNVDSTSSEAKRSAPSTSDSPGAQGTFCDSNSDLSTVKRTSVASDDSCSESMGVSSSEACASHKNNGLHEAVEKEERGGTQCSNDNEVFSTVILEAMPPRSQQECLGLEQESNEDQSIESSNISVSLNLIDEGQKTSQQSQTISPGPASLSSSPSSSSLPSSVSFSSVSTALPLMDTSCSPGSPSSSDLHLAHTVAGCPNSTSSSQVAMTSPISSSMEAAPVVKKKVIEIFRICEAKRENTFVRLDQAINFWKKMKF